MDLRQVLKKYQKQIWKWLRVLQAYKCSSTFFSAINNVVKYYDHIWVGYTDQFKEGEWRFLNGELYNAGDKSQTAFAYWATGQPDNYPDGQDCGLIFHRDGITSLDDDHCSDKWYGLCEIRHNTCEFN